MLGLLSGWALGGQYFAGFLVEKSLSIDNLFVFVIIVGTFAVPAPYQSRALTTGIVLALILRALFIALGATLLDAFSIMFLVFGLALIATSVQLFRHRDADPKIEDNPIVSAARKSLPITREYDGGRFVTRERGRRMLTPMFLVLVALGTTDLLFALDSIPAVFGVTTQRVRRLLRQRVRAARAAAAVRARLGSAEPARVPRGRPVGDPRADRRQARAPFRPPAPRRRARDLDRRLAVPDRRDPGRDHGHQPAPHPARPEPARRTLARCAPRRASTRRGRRRPAEVS